MDSFSFKFLEYAVDLFNEKFGNTVNLKCQKLIDADVDILGNM